MEEYEKYNVIDMVIEVLKWCSQNKDKVESVYMSSNLVTPTIENNEIYITFKNQKNIEIYNQVFETDIDCYPIISIQALLKELEEISR